MNVEHLHKYDWTFLVSGQISKQQMKDPDCKA